MIIWVVWLLLFNLVVAFVVQIVYYSPCSFVLIVVFLICGLVICLLVFFCALGFIGLFVLCMGIAYVWLVGLCVCLNRFLCLVLLVVASC